MTREKLHWFESPVGDTRFCIRISKQKATARGVPQCRRLDLRRISSPRLYFLSSISFPFGSNVTSIVFLFAVMIVPS
jgi:hypothetical protein